MKAKLIKILGTLLAITGLGLLSTPSAAQLPSSFASESIMAKGRWVKIRIGESNIYRISFEELRKQGFSNPEKVGVYGFGGAILPEDLSRIYTHDLAQVPIYREGENIYFYGQGVNSWYYNPEKLTLEHSVNVYSRAGYYLLSDAAEPLQMDSYKPGSSEPEATFTQYNEILLHELEAISIKDSGRDLYGESLGINTSRTIPFNLRPNTINSANVDVTLSWVSRPKWLGGSGEINVFLNGVLTITDRISLSSYHPYYSFLGGIKHRVYAKKEISGLSGKLNVDLNYSTTGDNVFLDFLEIATLNDMHYDGSTMNIRHFTQAYSPGKNYRYRISNGNNLKVFFANNSNSCSLVNLQNAGDAAEFIAEPLSADGKVVNTFLALELSKAAKPEFMGELPNQNIRASGELDLIIISPDALLIEANRLADFHREREEMRVLVLTQSQVFNEFSGGTPDATAIRLMSKMFFERWKASNSSGVCPTHLLLFGDGASDNRKLSAIWNSDQLQNTEFILTYQGVNSLNIFSYVSDDYFVAVDNQPASTPIGLKRPVLGVGRFPIRNLEQAKIAVDKTISYIDDKSPGVWQTRTCFVADNGDSHAIESLRLTDTIKTFSPATQISRVYMDTYQRVVENGLPRVPGAKKKMLEELDKGLLILNYNGHGGPAGWADEQQLTMTDIGAFKYKHLPIWITATCDFSNFDNVNTSAGEEVFLKPKTGGAVLFTTTRVVMNTQNEKMNGYLLRRLFDKGPDGRYRSMGTVLAEAKRDMMIFSPGSGWGQPDSINNLSFTLLGDPTIRFKLPTHQAVLKSINGLPLEQEADGSILLKSLQRVELKGQIENDQGQLDASFNGQAVITVYDGMRNIKAIAIPGNNFNVNYNDYTNVIYAGVTTVKDGLFSSEFIVPKDVQYSETSSKINLYAYSPETKADAMGVNYSMKIALGESPDNIVDTIAPKVVKCYLNDSTFRSGDAVNATPLFVAEIFELNGLNISGSGLGHDMTLVIDGHSDYTYNLNSHYNASFTEAGMGSVHYMLPELAEGDHTARLTVWDVFNNVSTYDFKFRVVKGLAPNIGDIIVFPNPIKGDEATFRIFHNRPESDQELSIEIFDFTGRLVSKTGPQIVSSGFSEPIDVKWDLRSKYGVTLPNGLYLYRCVLSTPQGQSSSETKKLIIDRQY